MADPHVVSALRAKRDELDRIIISYEGALAEASKLAAFKFFGGTFATSFFLACLAALERDGIMLDEI